MGQINFEWVIEERLATQALAILEKQGGRILAAPEPFEPSVEELDELGDSAFEPMMVIAAALAIGALIRIISDVTLKHRYPGGELFDLRGGKLKRLRIPSLEKGTLVIITQNKTQTFPPAKQTEGLAILENALKGLAGG